MTREEASKIIKDGLEDMSLDFADEEQYEALTMAIKALEQEPTDDLISRQVVLETQTKYTEYIGATKFWQMRDDIKALPPVTQKSKIGYWFAWKPEDDVWRTTCSECGEETRTLWNYCPHCGAKMVEPQETETWNSIHTQITAPKGTFERIFNDADDDNDI